MKTNIYASNASLRTEVDFIIQKKFTNFRKPKMPYYQKGQSKVVEILAIHLLINTLTLPVALTVSKCLGPTERHIEDKIAIN